MLSCAMLKLTNTLTGAAEPFTPATASRFACTHAGLPSTTLPTLVTFERYVFEDVLRRHLKSKWKLLHVMNITDIDDKIIRKSTEKGVDIRELHSALHRCILRRQRAASHREDPTSSLLRPTTFRRWCNLVEASTRKWACLSRRQLDLLPHLEFSRLRPAVATGPT